MPRFLQRIGATGDPTVMCLDTRDGRIVSPFQHEHPFVIEVNAEAGINRLTEHNQTLAPNAGVYLTLYYVVTTNTHKLNMAIAFDVPEGVACGLWDSASAKVLKHEAFAPFDWPDMSESSPPYVDLKVKLKGRLLCHFILKSFRSKTDLTPQKQWIDEDLLRTASDEDLSEVQVQHTVFQGYQVCSRTFEAGKRVYTLATFGTIVALSEPRSQVELRRIAWGSVDLHGSEPDRLEYRFNCISNNLAVACNRMQVPPSWIVLSNISGPACATIIQEARNSGAVAQSPDQHLQFGQLSAIHASWFPNSTALPNEGPSEPLVRKVRVHGDDRQNKHVIVSAPARFLPRSVVEFDALALGAHDNSVEAPAIVMPPIAGLGTVVLAAPQLANDTIGAGGLAPMLAGPLRQIQPEIALGRIEGVMNPDQVWAAPMPGQTPVQRPDEVHRRDEPVPVFSRTIEERRAPPPPPKAPPPTPVGEQALRGLSAPTTMSQLLGDVARYHAAEAGQAQQRLGSQADERLVSGQAQLRQAEQQLQFASTYSLRCEQQVLNMTRYIEEARLRGEEGERLQHYATLLVRDRTTLQRADEQVQRAAELVSAVRQEVETLFVASQPLIEEMS